MSLVFSTDLNKAIVTSEPHKRVLRRAAVRISRELDRRSQMRLSSGKETELDTAHLEQAFRHHRELYPQDEDWLIRMSLLLRGAGKGHIQDSDIHLLNMLPFAVRTPTPRTSSYMGSDTTQSRFRRISPSINKVIRILPMMCARIAAENNFNEICHIIALNFKTNNQVPHYIIFPNDPSTHDEEYKDLIKPENMEKLVQKYIDNPIKFKYNDISNSIKNKENFPRQLISSETDRIAGFFDAYIKQKNYIKSMDEFISKKFKSKQLIRRYYKYIKEAPFERIKDLPSYKMGNSRTSPEQIYKDTENEQINPWYNKNPDGTHSIGGYYGPYQQTADNLPYTVMDWLHRFAVPKTVAKGGRHRKLYHATEASDGFYSFDPAKFKTILQNYGIGTYATMLPYLARTIMPNKYMATLHIPKHFKFLWHDKDYGKGKENEKLLNKIDNYFDELCDQMGRKDLKGIFVQSLKDAFDEAPGSSYNHFNNQFDIPDYAWDSQLRTDELNDMYGHRGMVKLRAELEDPENHEGFFKDGEPDHIVTIGKDILRHREGTYRAGQIAMIYRSMKIPGWALHRAIKYTFEKLGAPSSGGMTTGVANGGYTTKKNPNDPSSPTIYVKGIKPPSAGEGEDDDEDDYGAIGLVNRNAAYHTTMLLSSLGFHGYMHFDPETRGALVDIGPRYHPSQVSDTNPLQKLPKAKRLNEKQANKIKSCVLFGSALSDMPLPSWGIRAPSTAFRDNGMIHRTEMLKIAAQDPNKIYGIPSVITSADLPKKRPDDPTEKQRVIRRFSSARTPEMRPKIKKIYLRTNSSGD